MKSMRTSLWFIFVFLLWSNIFFSGGMTSAQDSASGTPSIEFTYVPLYGSYNADVYGRVVNISSSNHKIAVYIKVNGGWWTKPSWDHPTNPINDDGSWSCDITTGGTDYQATEIAAYAIPNTYSPPSMAGGSSLPDELNTNAVAHTQVTRSPTDPLLGLNYGPHRTGQAPWGESPTPAQIEEDMALIAQKVKVIRIYSSQGVAETIVDSAAAHGVQVVAQAWIDQDTANNQREITAAINLANRYPYNVIAVLVGSEVLLRNDQSETVLRGYIQQVQDGVSVPVGYADIYYEWTTHTTLLDVVDWVGLHSYGFWNCQTVDQSDQYAVNEWQNLRVTSGFENKRVILFETGWPNAGYNPNCPDQTPGSKSSQTQFVSDMLSLAETENMDLFVFEVADEPWKCTAEPVVGCHWGLLSATRNLYPAWNVLPDIWPMHLVAPKDGFITNDPTPTFSWSKVPPAAKYRIQIDNNSDFSSPAVTIYTSGASYTPTSNLTSGLYYWRVQARWGNWSEVRTVTIDTVKPSKPRLLSPATGSTISNGRPAFDWNNVAGAHRYQLQVDNNANFSSPEINTYTSVSDYTPGSSLANGLYYWRVQARDAAGNWSGWSTAWSFKVPPAKPILRSPQNNATINDNTPTFSWRAVTGAVKYSLQVDNNSDFSSPLCTITQTAISYTRATALADRTYYWRVRAKDAAGNWGNWSAGWSFVLDAVPLSGAVGIPMTPTSSPTRLPTETATSRPTVLP